MAEVYRIIVEEKVGVNAITSGVCGSSFWAWYAANGCKNPKKADPVEAECPTPGEDFIAEHHVNPEIWGYGIDHRNKLAPIYEERTALIVGTIGWLGWEGTTIGNKPHEQAMDEKGLALEYYRSYNASWHSTGKYFTPYDKITPEKIMDCDGEINSLTNDLVIGNVLEWVGALDPDGFETVDGKRRAKCVNNKWWLSPACRKVPAEECVAWTTGGSGWWISAMLQKSILFNMPMAISIAADWGSYTEVPNENDMLWFWWMPDTTYLKRNPMRVNFPAYNAEEWSKGNQRTNGEDQEIYKTAYYGLKTAENGETPYVVFENMQWTFEVIMDLLNDQLATGADDYTAACKWIQNHPDRWEPWVPDKTKCSPGQGLLNEISGKYVTTRAEATTCEWCPAGQHSKEIEDEKGITQICTPCTKGTYQGFPAMSECFACDAGRFSAETGQRVCEPCPKGYSQSETGAVECNICKVGTVAPNNEMKQCMECELGTAVNEQGQTACNNCFLGYYADSLGQSECTFCAEGKKNPETWTTMKKVTQRSGEQQWAYFEAAPANSTCGCDKGYQQSKDGECEECGEGMICHGMSEIEIELGYSWDGELSTFRCYGELKRCPGGKPGVCAEGRDPTSIACTQCLKGKKPGKDGVCVECDGSDQGPFVIFCLAVPCIIIALYFGMERVASKRINASMPHLLLMMCLTMLATLIQQLMVIGLLHLEWEAPMTYLFEAFQILIFDIDVLNVSCVARFTPAGKYGMRMLLLYVAVAFLWSVHAFATLFVWKGGFKANSYRVIRSVGTIMAFFYISVVSSIMTPFNCTDHPNGLKTLVSDTAVLCDSSDATHSEMTGYGLVGAGMPLFFLGVVLWATYQFPMKMSVGDTSFLNSWNFLFMRFTTKAYWYPAVVVIRNTLITFAPLFGGPVSQITTLAILMMASLWICIFYMPWRLKGGNILDIACHMVVNLVLLLCSFFVKEEQSATISSVCFTFIMMALVSLAGVIAYSCSKRCSKDKKQFQFFLCHHKAGAGAFARLVKVYLLKNKKVTRKVFMDSDDLQDLDLLFGYVCSHTENFVLIISPELVKRPWCMGELVTAWSNKVSMIPMLTHGGEMPTEAFIEKYDSHVPDIDKIFKFGMDLDMVKDSLRHMTSLPKAIRVDQVSASWMEYTTSLLVAQGTNSSVAAIAPQMNAPSEQQQNGVTNKNTVVLVDHSNPEAASTALFLKDVIMPLIIHMPEKIPYILPADEDLPSNVQDLILILTNGLFVQEYVLQALYMAAIKASGAVLPVLTDENFRFPTADLSDPKSAVMTAVGKFGNKSDVLVDIINQCFQEIAIVFQPQLYSTTEAVIAAKAQEVTRRLMKTDRNRLKTTSTNEAVLSVSASAGM